MNEILIPENDELDNDNEDNDIEKLELGEVSKNYSEFQEINYLILHNLKDEYNYTKSIKVILLGESKVGKSSLIHRLCFGTYSDDLPPTTSFRQYDYFIKIEDFILRMQIWDISGKEKNDLTITNNFLDTDFAIFIYSIDDKESFNKIKDWFSILKKNNSNEIKTALLANKKDLDINKRVITFEQGQNLSKEFNFTIFKEISCKNDNEENIKNILDVFDNISLSYYKFYKIMKCSSIDTESFNYEASNSLIILGQNDNQPIKQPVEKKRKKKKCCCCC